MDLCYLCLHLIFLNIFSISRHVFSDLRKRLLPSHLESQMFYTIITTFGLLVG